MVPGIYKITNKSNGKLYVGKSIYVGTRWHQHLSHLKKGNHHNYLLQKDWNNYGSNAFSFELIKEAEPEYLDELEQFYIAFYDSMNNGYNLRGGNDGSVRYSRTKKRKKKKSEPMRAAHTHTGFFGVSQANDPRYRQGYCWKYMYTDENGKEISIKRYDLYILMLAVTLQDLPWKIVDLEKARATIIENNIDGFDEIL